jgi:murein DD-endopeptidase MepM/ murein hydrolase activator NlpD
MVGLVGNSGNSTEPHLHFHLSDANSPLACEGLPYALTAFEVQGRVEGLGAKMAWTPLATPESHRLEQPLANVIVRFPTQ